MNQSGDVIGFSVFELFEECYEYVENDCFIAGSREQAEAYQREAGLSAADARIDQVRLSDLLEDFAVSGGGHAMETEAFLRFQTAAQSALRPARIRSWRDWCSSRSTRHTCSHVKTGDVPSSPGGPIKPVKTICACPVYSAYSW